MDKLAGPVGGTSWTNPNGTYNIESGGDQSITLKGLGTEKSGGNPVQVTCTVTPDSLTTLIVN